MHLKHPHLHHLPSPLSSLPTQPFINLAQVFNTLIPGLNTSLTSVSTTTDQRANTCPPYTLPPTSTALSTSSVTTAAQITAKPLSQPPSPPPAFCVLHPGESTAAGGGAAAFCNARHFGTAVPLSAIKATCDSLKPEERRRV